MSRTYIEYRLMYRRLGEKRFSFAGKVQSYEVAVNRAKSYASQSGWEYRVDQRVVTVEEGPWKRTGPKE